MAETTACRMEHVIDSTTVDRLVCFIEYIHTCPRAGADWLDSFIRAYPQSSNDFDLFLPGAITLGLGEPYG